MYIYIYIYIYTHIHTHTNKSYISVRLCLSLKATIGKGQMGSALIGPGVWV